MDRDFKVVQEIRKNIIIMKQEEKFFLKKPTENIKLKKYDSSTSLSGYNGVNGAKSDLRW